MNRYVCYVLTRFSPLLMGIIATARFSLPYFSLPLLSGRPPRVDWPGCLGCVSVLLLMFLQRVCDDLRDFESDALKARQGDPLAARLPTVQGLIHRGHLRGMAAAAYGALLLCQFVPWFQADLGSPRPLWPLLAAASLACLLISRGWPRMSSMIPGSSAWIVFAYVLVFALVLCPERVPALSWQSLLGGGTILCAGWFPLLVWQFGRCEALRRHQGPWQPAIRRLGWMAFLCSMAVALAVGLLIWQPGWMGWMGGADDRGSLVPMGLALVVLAAGPALILSGGCALALGRGPQRPRWVAQGVAVAAFCGFCLPPLVPPLLLWLGEYPGVATIT